MNKTRRAALDKLQDRIEALKTAATAVNEEIDALVADLETIRDEEQESFDNLTDALQQTERGETMAQAVADIEDAMSTLDNIGRIDLDELDEAFSKIDDAKGQA